MNAAAAAARARRARPPSARPRSTPAPAPRARSAGRSTRAADRTSLRAASTAPRSCAVGEEDVAHGEDAVVGDPAGQLQVVGVVVVGVEDRERQRRPARPSTRPCPTRSKRSTAARSRPLPAGTAPRRARSRRPATHSTHATPHGTSRLEDRRTARRTPPPTRRRPSAPAHHPPARPPDAVLVAERSGYRAFRDERARGQGDGEGEHRDEGDQCDRRAETRRDADVVDERPAGEGGEQEVQQRVGAAPRSAGVSHPLAASERRVRHQVRTRTRP